MVFIDGGYFRKNLKEKANQSIDSRFRDVIPFVSKLLVTRAAQGIIAGELIRTYYYDALYDETAEEEKKQEQNKFLKRIRAAESVQVRLGHLVKGDEGYRQKGVDVLMAIDMLSKAYENQYDIAIMVAGDGDFVHLVEAVKDSGKRVYGAFFPGTVSDDLVQSFDRRIEFDLKTLNDILNYRL